MDWEYYTLCNGRLVDEQGYDIGKNFPSFSSTEQAEAYLIKFDIRGSIR